MKQPWILRAVVIVSTLVILAVALFGILYAEGRKRTSQREAAEADLSARLREAEASRRSYEEARAAEREKLRGIMDRSKAEYEDLLARQEGLVEESQVKMTETVSETVPVQVPVKTRDTKSS
ncbi:MAG: hypothetical protein HGA33_02130 [Candidatus Moranbacteria bacterium]|nr:hypothetical protein [Candidatus Moranbacteria bacterium]